MGRHLTSGLQLISLRGRKGHIQEVGQGYGLCDNEESQIIEECLIQFSLLDLQLILYEPDWSPSSMAKCPKFAKSPSFSSFSWPSSSLSFSANRRAARWGEALRLLEDALAAAARAVLAEEALPVMEPQSTGRQ